MTKEVYKNSNGYLEDENGELIHRQRAYREIYRKNKEKYPLAFGDYQVHHKNQNKVDNRVVNLQIVTKEEHEAIHGIKHTKIVENGAGTILLGIALIIAGIFTFAEGLGIILIAIGVALLISNSREQNNEPN